MAYKMKGFSGFGNSPLKQKTTKSDTVKTYPKSYTKEDIKFLKEQREDVVRRSDFDEGSEQQKMFDRNQYEPPVKPADKIPMEQWYKEEEEETKKINK